MDQFVYESAHEWEHVQGTDMDLGMRIAAKNGNKELVELLIKHGANNWHFGMCGAAQGGHKELVEFFVEHGARDFNSGMICAVRSGHKELVEFFMEHGADTFHYGMYCAALHGYKDIAELLIKHGATNLNYGLQCAAQGGHKKLVEFFVKQGANNWNWGMFGAILGCHKELVQFFIDQGADNINQFPLFYKDICRLYHLPNGVLINKLLRRYIARFKGNKLRNEKVIINDIYESTLDQVFISPPGTIVKFRNETHVIKGHIFYLLKSRNPQFK